MGKPIESMFPPLALGPDLGFVSAGLVIGLLVGPAVHILLARREWQEASRYAELTDELLERPSSLSRPLEPEALPSNGTREPRAPS